MLHRVLQTIRIKLRGKPALARVARLVGVTRMGKAIYYRLVRAERHHEIELLGQKLVFAVTSGKEIDRLDSMAGEEPLIARVLAILEPGDVIYDVGANIGVIALALASSKSNVVVHAFEPEPRNVAHLRSNVRLNHLTNRVFCHQLALGSKNGVASLHVSGEVGEGTHTLVDDGRARSAEVSVDVQTADDFAKANQSPDVVKIDVEGGEVEVLAGMTSLLANQTIRHLFIEVHLAVLSRDGWDEDRLAAWLDGFGYDSVWVATRGEESHQHYQLRGP